MGFLGEMNLSLAGLVCLVASGLVLSAARLEGQGVSREELQQALADLEAKVEKAKEQEVPTLYAEVPLNVGATFLERDWEEERIAERRADWAAFLRRQIHYESRQLDALLAGAPDRSPALPALG